VGGLISRQKVRLRSPQEPLPTETNLRIATGEIEDLAFEMSGWNLKFVIEEAALLLMELSPG
jgi:hypothetical protein